MKYHLNPDEKEALYLQLYHAIKSDIASGALKFGDKLPSKRFIAEELSVSVITVEHAYTLLMDEGFIESRPKSGFYVSYAPAIKPGSKKPPAILEPIQEPPDDFPYNTFERIMRNVITQHGRRILARSENNGIYELREAISDYLKRSRGIGASPDDIIIGSGAESLYPLVGNLIGRNAKIGVEDPGFEKIRKIYESYGFTVEPLPMGEDGIESEALKNTHLSAIHVTPYRSYPTGITATEAKRHEYVNWAVRTNGYIIEDDYASELAAKDGNIDTVYSINPNRVIYINTFTKTIAPSMRTGYLILPPKLLARYKEEFSHLSCSVPVYEQLVIAEFIRGGYFERCINKRRRNQRKADQ